MKSKNYPFDFQFDQESVEDISQIKDLKWSNPELFKTNNQYGQASVLKEYAGLPGDYPLRVNMEHAIVLGGISNIAKKNLGEATLTPSTIRIPIINKEPGARAIPIGFGYLYAKKLFEKFNLDPIHDCDRKGTIVFPFKVIKTTKVEFDHSSFAEQVKNLPEKYQPVYVCTFYRDVPEVSRIYQDAGIPVVTAGHRLDPLFFYRFHDICRRFRYAASNAYGTNLFLSIHSGCRFFYIKGPEAIFDESTIKSTDNKVGEVYESNLAETWRLFGEPVEEITPEQQTFADSFLGVESMKTPEKLRRILLKEQRRYENRPWWHSEKKLFYPPDCRNFTWSHFPPNRGWDGLRKDGDVNFRWIGQTKETWVDLSYSRNFLKGNSLLSCDAHVLTCENLRITINGRKIPDLKKSQISHGTRFEGIISPKFLKGSPTKGVMRIGFKASGKEVASEFYKAPPRSAAISRISLKFIGD